MSQPYPHEEKLNVPVSIFLELFRDSQILGSMMSKLSVKNYVESNSILISHMMRDQQISHNIMELKDDVWSRYTAIALKVWQTPATACSPNTPPFEGHQAIDGPYRQDSQQDTNLDATLSRTSGVPHMTTNNCEDQYRTESPYRTNITSKTIQGKATTKIGEVEASARHQLNIKSESETNDALTELQKLNLKGDVQTNIGASSQFGNATTNVGSIQTKNTNNRYGGNYASVGHGIAIAGSSQIMGDVTYHSQTNRGSNQQFEHRTDNQPRIQDSSRHPSSPKPAQKRPNTEPSSFPVNPPLKRSENSPSRSPVTSPQNQPENRPIPKSAYSTESPPHDQSVLRPTNHPINPSQNQPKSTSRESVPLSAGQNATILAGAKSKMGAAKVKAEKINITVEDPGQPVNFTAESEDNDATMIIGTMNITTKLPQENIKNYHIGKVVGALYVESTISSTITGAEGADIRIAETSVTDTDK